MHANMDKTKWFFLLTILKSSKFFSLVSAEEAFIPPVLQFPSGCLHYLLHVGSLQDLTARDFVTQLKEWKTNRPDHPHMSYCGHLYPYSVLP